jgi:hypothetical protein
MHIRKICLLGCDRGQPSQTYRSEDRREAIVYVMLTVIRRSTTMIKPCISAECEHMQVFSDPTTGLRPTLIRGVC